MKNFLKKSFDNVKAVVTEPQSTRQAALQLPLSLVLFLGMAYGLDSLSPTNAVKVAMFWGAFVKLTHGIGNVRTPVENPIKQESEGTLKDVFRFCAEAAIGKNSTVRALKMGALMGVLWPPIYMWQGVPVSQKIPAIALSMLVTTVVVKIFRGTMDAMDQHYGYAKAPIPAPAR